MDQPPALKTRRKSDVRGVARKRALLEVATVEFLDHGYEGASMDRILKAAGGSRTTLYTHFTNKAGLYVAVFNHAAEQLVASVSMPLDEAEPPEQALRKFGYSYLDYLLGERSLKMQRVTQAEATRFASIGLALIAGNRERLVAPLEQYLRASPHIADDSTDHESAAQILVAMLKGELHLKALMDSTYRPTPEDIRRHVNACVKIFLHGLAA